MLTYYSIAYKYQNEDFMIHIYNFFMKNRLYSDFKFYRISQIKEFLLIKDYQKLPKNTFEYTMYKKFILNWVKYKNPSWYNLSLINKIR